MASAGVIDGSSGLGEAVGCEAVSADAAAGWAGASVGERLRVVRKARHILAEGAAGLVDALPRELARTRADSLAAEVLPLLEAMRFLEREAVRVLRTRRLGRRGLPFWLAGTVSAVERVAMGRVLVIGPGNYPLFLPGVQVMQALAAGNAVVWKPGRGGGAVARVVAEALRGAGLPEGLLRVTGESVEEGMEAIGAGPGAAVDLVVLTGSAEAGRAVLRVCAERLVPVIAELSGCDACFVLPGADAERVSAALGFGMRLNGSATCMAPRRLILVGGGHGALVERVLAKLSQVEAVPAAEGTRRVLGELLREAVAGGAEVEAGVFAELEAGRVRPVLVRGARAEMRLLQADVFAPVLSVVEAADARAALEVEAACPFGLTAAIFGPEREALAFGKGLRVGTVLVNDLIVSTADPRVPFGGRRGSGFGVTRGAEGLLAMTAARTVLVRRGRQIRQYAPTGEAHEALFSGVLRMTHGRGLRERIAGMRAMVQAAMRLK